MIERERVIAEYHEMLAADDSLAAELFARLRAGMSAARLLYGETPLGVSLRPHFLAQKQYGALKHASEVLAGAFEKVAQAMLARPRLMDVVGLSDAERRAAFVEPGYSCPAVTTRLDAFVTGDEIKFVEYNAENPSSLSDQEGLNQLLFEVPAMGRLAERYRLRQFTPARRLLDALLETFREWGGRGVPNVAIVDWPDLPTRHEFVLLRNLFVSSGVPTIICAPDELEYAGGRLRREEFQIDLVYKRVIIHELLERCDERHPLMRAYVDRAVCLVNPLRCKLVHKKAAFELLTDETCESWFTPVEREVIQRCVPWTRKVSERKTLYEGRKIDLLEHVRAHRTAFILKPNDDYGGHGVCLGKSVTEIEWEAMMKVALAGDYVVQKVVELRTEEFPVFNERAWGLQPMYVDTNPFIFRGRAHGAMVRLSSSPIVNVSSGGGETGFFVIEGAV
jgi:glutathionylspermidine synthase